MSAPGTNKVDFEVKGDIAVVTLDHYPVNTLTNAVQLGLEDASINISKDSKIKGVVVRGAGLRALCAGADIQDLNKKHDRYPTKNFVECFEELNIPVVALLQGFTLGGGFEMSLGCHYRVITPNGFIGLPEVNIGLLPGGQGTQRLPRLVGIQPALQVMLTGQHVSAKKAKEMGVVDAILSKDAAVSREAQLSEAIAFLRTKMSDDLSKRRISNLPAPKMDAKTEEIFSKTEKQMKAGRRNEIAPQLIIDCVKAAVNEQNFKKGVGVEQELFFKALTSKEAAGLQHAFFAERAAGKVANNKEKAADVKKVGILGAGTMGGGIAMCFANIGVEVLLIDREDKFLENGLKVISGNYERSVKSGSRSQAQVDKAMKLIKTSTKYEDLGDVDLVIEAVFEDLNLKKEIFAKLDKVCKKDCILASNTSYLNIDAMAEKTTRPEKVIGMHFFSPANVMKLLENIRGRWTDDKTVKTIMEISTKIGKWPVLVNNRWGFVGNRMLKYYSQEANRMVLQGVDFKRVDKIAVQFGMPMGPFRMSDLVGLDIGYQARKKAGQTNEEKSIVDALIAAGHLGMKNGKGWYQYDGRNQSASPEAEKIIAQVIKNNNLKQENLTDDEIRERLFFPIINEGFRILEERVAQKPDDVDVVFIHGYNWPRVTGGPMFYADQIGIKKVLSILEKHYKSVPESSFKPAQLLVDVAQSGSSLAKYWSKNQSKYIFDKMKATL